MNMNTNKGNNPNNVYKVLFMGSMGAGKTTAIQQLSQTKIVSTDVKNNDTERFDKPSTTVGMDYGIINIDDTTIHLYGSPGQEKFSFVWETLIKGCSGVLVLINAEQSNAKEELNIYLSFLKNKAQNIPITVGIGRMNDKHFNIKEYEEILDKYSISCPIFLLDVRNPKDSLFLLESLIYQIFD